MDFHVAFANSTEQRHLPGHSMVPGGSLACWHHHGPWLQQHHGSQYGPLRQYRPQTRIIPLPQLRLQIPSQPCETKVMTVAFEAIWAIDTNIISGHSTDQGHHMTPGGNRGHGHQLRPSCSKTEDPDKVLSGSIDHRHQNGFKWQHMLLTSTQPLVVSWPMGINMASCSNTVLKHSHGQRK